MTKHNKLITEYVITEITYQCPFCGLWFSKRSYLRTHVRATCTQKPDYKYKLQFPKL